MNFRFYFNNPNMLKVIEPINANYAEYDFGAVTMFGRKWKYITDDNSAVKAAMLVKILQKGDWGFIAIF